jgi:hypothetical protein
MCFGGCFHIPDIEGIVLKKQVHSIHRWSLEINAAIPLRIGEEDSFYDKSRMGWSCRGWSCRGGSRRRGSCRGWSQTSPLRQISLNKTALRTFSQVHEFTNHEDARITTYRTIR